MDFPFVVVNVLAT